MSKGIEVGRRLKAVGAVIEIRGCCWLAMRSRGPLAEYTMGEVVMHRDSSIGPIGVAPRGDDRILELFRSKADAITARRDAEFDPDMVTKVWG